MDMNVVYRFSALFQGNARSHGVWNKSNGKMATEHKPASADDFKMHLQGETGVGVVPIMDDATVVFAAIDIDNHGQKEDIPLQPVVARLAEKGYPLVACRSKSGGIHCYLFTDTPVPAHKVRSFLAAVASDIGFPSAEIFPKQDKLMKDASSGELALGNWINLGYFGGDDTVRYSVSKTGRKLSLEEFIDLAESRRVGESELESMVSEGHVEAPPCIQRFYTEGVPGGYRNQALYNITIYLRRARPDTFVDDAMDANNQIFDRPLPTTEAKRTIKSASRRDYKYKCGEEPCKSFCDSRKCLTKLYGITPDEEAEISNAARAPIFTGLVKFDTEPPRWGFTMNDRNIEGISTEELYNFSLLRKAVAEKLNMHVPALSSRRWDQLLEVMFKELRVVDVPKEASASGQAVSRLVDYLDKADARLQDGYDEMKEREKLLRGMPCIQVLDGTKHGVFKMTDFVKHLKNTRSEDLKGANLYFALRDQLGVETRRLRIKDKVTSVWAVPMANLHRQEPSLPDFKPEF